MFLRSGTKISSNTAKMPQENAANQSASSQQSAPIQQIIMTPDMLQALLSNLQNANVRDSDSPTQTTPSGNFSTCKTRFDGEPTSDVEAFIDAIVVYKDCLNISDVNALKGLSMLFTGNAAT